MTGKREWSGMGVFMKFFSFVFMGVKMSVSIGLRDLPCSLGCHMDDNVLVGVLMCVLNANRIVDQKPGGKAHQNQTQPEADVGFSGK